MSRRPCPIRTDRLFLLPLALASLALQADEVVYDEALQGGFQNWSWQSGGGVQNARLIRGTSWSCLGCGN